MSKEKFGPCEEKNCSYCCDPVKVPQGFLEEKIPVDKKGEKIWKKIDKLLIPESCPDTDVLKIYKCINYNKKTGKCMDYENRPKICRNTTCIDNNSKESIDEQHKNVASEEFFEVKQ